MYLAWAAKNSSFPYLEMLRGYQSLTIVSLSSRTMKVVVLIGILIVAWYVDNQYYHGQYFRAMSSMTQRIASSFGLR